MVALLAGTEPELISIGSEGLDNVLAGGLPTSHLYLIEGDPGTGKTTLGLQFLLNGVKAGEPVLYITLSESERELRQVAASHQWALDTVNIFELLPMEDTLKVEEQYTVFHPGEIELTETIRAVLQKIEEIQPRRVVFDSLSELRLLAREQLRFRRQLLALKQYFAGRNCTVLFLDDRTTGENERDLQSIAHGVIRLETVEREYGSNRRRMKIVKLRGVRFREGFHDYNIRTGGLVVYPRLVASEHHTTFSRELILSGIKELDFLLGGGLNKGTSTLMMGPAGVGKSTIALRYAASAAERGEYAYFIMFDETLPTLIERAEGLGINIRPLLDNGKLHIRLMDPTDISPGYFISTVREEVERKGASVVVIDSINGLLAALPGEHNFIVQLHELLVFLNLRGVATILVMAQYGILGQSMGSPVDVSYLADTILLLRYFESSGEVQQAISVVKRRSGKHERTIRELELGPEAIRIGKPLTEFQGILTGVPTYVGTKRQLRGNKSSEPEP